MAILLTKVIAPLDILAREFVPKWVVDKPSQVNVKSACLADAAEVLQKVLQIKRVYKSEEGYEIELGNFQRRQGDLATYVSQRLEKEDTYRIIMLAQSQKVDSCQLTPEELMRRVITKALPYEDLERITIGRYSRQEVKQKLVEDYKLRRGEIIDLNVLEGKHDSIVIRLIGDSFRRDLARNWERFYWWVPGGPGPVLELPTRPQWGGGGEGCWPVCQREGRQER